MCRIRSWKNIPGIEALLWRSSRCQQSCFMGIYLVSSEQRTCCGWSLWRLDQNLHRVVEVQMTQEFCEAAVLLKKAASGSVESIEMEEMDSASNLNQRNSQLLLFIYVSAWIPRSDCLKRAVASCRCSNQNSEESN